MASKLIRAITALSLALTFYFSAATASVQAASSADLSPLKLHTFKFYLDPALVPDVAFAKAVLSKYVSDMNAILAKNTSRQLVFDPETDIITISKKPQTDSAPAPLPTEGFEIWAHVTQTTYSLSYGGYASVDVSGAGVLAGMNWTRLYDPDALSAADVLDYSKQIGTMLHEMAHVFKAGIGEYYSLATITDTTSIEPLFNINLNSPWDPYWSDKPDFMADPLLQLTRADTRAGYLSKVRYSNLTAAVISGDYRNGIPSFDHFTVQVLDRNGQPTPDAQVKVWTIQAISPYANQLLYDVQTDDTGQVTLAWGIGSILRLIKVYNADGVAIAQPKYISIFDADIAKLVKGQSSFTVTMQPADQAPTDVTLSGASLDENQPAGATIGSLSAVDPDAGDSASYSFCGGPDDASFQLSGDSLQAAVAFDYEIKNSFSICIRADDGLGGSLQKSFTLSVNDLPDTSTDSFSSLGANDGWVLESSKGSNAGGSIDAASTTSRLGNDAANRRYRSVLAFNTSNLPDDAIIAKVTLKIKRQGLVGTNPFSAFKSLTVDMGEPIIGTKAGLQNVDFQAQVGQSSVGTFGSKLTNGWYSAELNASALALLNLQGATQFRLRFSGTGNTGADYLAFYSGNANLANRPLLVVEYELPGQ